MIKQVTFSIDKFCNCATPKIYWSIESDRSLALHCLNCDIHLVCEYQKLSALSEIEKKPVSCGNGADEMSKRNAQYSRWLDTKANTRKQIDAVGSLGKKVEELVSSPKTKFVPEKNKIAWYRAELEAFLKETCPEESEVVVTSKPELIH